MLAGLTALMGGGGGGGGSFESIATGTGTGSSNTITFSSIPNTYKHLQIRALEKITDAGSGLSSLSIVLNSDSGLNYPYHRLFGNGTTVYAQGYDATNGGNGMYVGAVTTTGLTSIFGTAIYDFHDYASSSKYKTMRGFAGADYNGNGQVHLTSSVWLNTAAITSISLVANTTNWASGTQFALYGIKG